MPAKKVSEPAHVNRWISGTRDNSFKAASRLRLQRVYHAVRGFSDGNYKDPTEGVNIVKIFANSQHPALARYVLFKCAGNAGFRECIFEELKRQSAHLRNEWF